MGFRRLAVFWMVLPVVVSGCLSLRFEDGSEIAEERIALIRPGVTTKQQIIEWFGPPENFSDPSSLESLIADGGFSSPSFTKYPFSDILTFQRSRGRARGLLLVLWNYVDARLASDLLVVFFDEEDRVLYYGFRKGTDAID